MVAGKSCTRGTEWRAGLFALLESQALKPGVRGCPTNLVKTKKTERKVGLKGSAFQYSFRSEWGKRNIHDASCCNSIELYLYCMSFEAPMPMDGNTRTACLMSKV